MTTLANDKLLKINGGASFSILKKGLIGILAAGVFIASIIYGYIHPNKCS